MTRTTPRTGLFAAVLPATKSNPDAAVGWEPEFSTVAIANKRSVTEYRLAEIPTTWKGRAFRLVKAAGETGTDREAESYSVFCGEGSERSTCECRGFLRWGRPCKHIAALESLLAKQWL